MFETICVLVFFVVVVVIAIASYIQSRSQEKAKAQRDENLRREFAAWRQAVERLGNLPQVNTSLIMKNGEYCYYCCAGVPLYEVRSARTSTYAGASQGLGHGLRVGGGQGYSTSHDVWREVAVGTLTMTNRRVYFNGDKQDRNVPLREIMSIDSSPTMLEISSEKRQRSMVFGVGNGLKAGYILNALVRNSQEA